MLEASRQFAGRSLTRLQEARQDGIPGDVVHIWGILNRRRAVVGGTLLVALLIGSAVQILSPRLYSATDRVVIDFRRLENVNPNEAVYNFRLSDAAVDSQVAIMLSDNLLGAVVDKYNLSGDKEFAGPDFISGFLAAIFRLAPDNAELLRQNAIVALRKRLKIERQDLSYLITIEATSYVPEKAVKLADAVAEAFVQDQFASRREVADAANQWFRDKLAELQGQVAEAERAAVDFRLNNQIMMADGKFIDETQVQDLSLRLIDAQQQRVLAEAQLARIRKILSTNNLNLASVGGIFDKSVANSGDVAGGTTSIASGSSVAAGSVLAAANRRTATPAKPEIGPVNLDASVGGSNKPNDTANPADKEHQASPSVLDKNAFSGAAGQAFVQGGDYNAIVKGGVGQAVTSPVINSLLSQSYDIELKMRQNINRFGENHESVVKARNDLAEIQKSIRSEFERIAQSVAGNVEVMKDQETVLSSMLQNIAKRSTESQKLRVEMDLLRGRADSFKSVLDNFLTQFTVATQKQSYPITETRVVDHAATPQQASFPRPVKVLGFFGAVGLILGMGGAIATEILSRRVRTRRQIELVTSHRCLGYLPERERNLGRFGQHHWLDSFKTEMLRAIRTELKMQTVAGDLGTIIAFVGINGGDGATSSLIDFARYAANMGDRVLLIDCDLRGRSISKSLGDANAFGLQEVLAGQHVEHLVQRDQESALDILSCSDAGLGIAGKQILESLEMQNLLARCRQNYDFIFIDLPPISSLMDARLMSSLVDGYILMMKWNSTLIEDAIDAMRKNPQIERKLLGTIFNRISVNRARLVEDNALISTIEYFKTAKIS